MIGLILLSGTPIENLKICNVPNENELLLLNHSNEDYTVYLKDSMVLYNKNEIIRAKGEPLPFKIKVNKKNKYYFAGTQVNQKIDNGWLVGYDRGEWGGFLYWFSNDGSEHVLITEGNIKDIFIIGGQIYVIEGLAHLTMSKGQIFKIKNTGSSFKVEKFVDLAYAPESAVVIPNDEILIVTSNDLIKVTKEGHIETLIENGFWKDYLYPNSILLNDNTIYIGMRAGIFKCYLHNFDKQEWLTEK